MAEDKRSIFLWINQNRALAVDVLRIYLGIGFFLKGLAFMLNEHQIQLFMQQADLQVLPFFTIHYIIAAHIGGGILLVFGLLTRLAALAQIPILCGAILFVNQTFEMFGTNQALEYLLLLLFLMVLFVVYGSGRISVDNLLSKKYRQLNQ